MSRIEILDEDDNEIEVCDQCGYFLERVRNCPYCGEPKCPICGCYCTTDDWEEEE